MLLFLLVGLFLLRTAQRRLSSLLLLKAPPRSTRVSGPSPQQAA